MPCFGAFCPLPLRLGGSREEGWTPEDHARLSNDVQAAKRSVPLAIWTYDQSSGLSVVISAYFGMNGVGLTKGPVPVYIGVGHAFFIFPASLVDAYGRERGLNFVHCEGSADAGIVTHNFSSASTLHVRTLGPSATPYDGKATVAIW